MMFDETSKKWIERFKTFVLTMFWLYLAAAVVLCICGWSDCFWITDTAFMDGIIFLAGGTLIAFGHLLLGMVIVQLLNNIQIIREKIVSIEKNNKSKETQNF